MGKFEYKPDDLPGEQKPHRDKYDSSHCAVYGCPRAGHILTANWNCRYHHGRSGESLSRITFTLKNHARVFDWYEYLLNRTQVDFSMGDIHKKAPHPFEVKQNETWKAYRARLQASVDELLGIVHEKKEREVPV